jgi:hypothetical protein
MPSFEELQNKSILGALGLKSLLEKTAQTAESFGTGLAGIAQRGVQKFREADPYTRAELGGLAGQVIGEVITGREAPRTADAIRQFPSILRQRKEQQQQQQLEKVKLLQERQAEQVKEERAIQKEAREERKEAREERKLQSELIKRGQVELNQENVGLVENMLDKPYGEKYINVSEDTGKAVFNQKKYEDDVISAEKDIAKTKLQFEKMDNVLNAIDSFLVYNEKGEIELTELGNAITASGTLEALGEKGMRLIGNPIQNTAMAKLKLIQANLGFDELQKMRDASPTGGALGQVSEKELGLLINAQKALEEGMTPEAFALELDRLRTGLLEFKEQGILSVDDILSKSVRKPTKVRKIYDKETNKLIEVKND